MLNYLHIHAASCKYQQSGAFELEDTVKEEVVSRHAPVLQLSCILILIKYQKRGQLKYLVGEHKRFFFFILTQ